MSFLVRNESTGGYEGGSTESLTSTGGADEIKARSEAGGAQTPLPAASSSVIKY